MGHPRIGDIEPELVHQEGSWYGAVTKVAFSFLAETENGVAKGSTVFASFVELKWGHVVIVIISNH